MRLYTTHTNTHIHTYTGTNTTTRCYTVYVYANMDDTVVVSMCAYDWLSVWMFEFFHSLNKDALAEKSKYSTPFMEYPTAKYANFPNSKRNKNTRFGMENKEEIFYSGKINEWNTSSHVMFICNRSKWHHLKRIEIKKKNLYFVPTHTVDWYVW